MHVVKWGLLTSLVRSQECSNCYAVVAAELLEHQMSTSFAVNPVSVQQIMDCTGFGCDGGSMEDTMAYIADHPITNQFSYDGSCDTSGVTADYEIHTNISEDTLLELLEKGPLGVVDGTHMVLLVGYDGQWILKNSYGTDWGDQGYYKTDQPPTDYVVEIKRINTMP